MKQNIFDTRPEVELIYPWNKEGAGMALFFQSLFSEKILND